MHNNKDIILYFKALADETRLAIIEMLSRENLCACHILEEFEITQPTLSYHMKILVESGLVDSERDGNWIRYSLNDDIIKGVGNKFLSLENKNLIKKNRKMEE